MMVDDPPKPDKTNNVEITKIKPAIISTVPALTEILISFSDMKY